MIITTLFLPLGHIPFKLGKADLPHTPLSIKISKRLERQPILGINILVSKLRYLH
jgi:hypothetical protein